MGGKMAIYGVGTLRIKEGKEEKGIELLEGWFKKIEDEKGTLVYSIFHSKKNPLKLLFYEKFADERAQRFHNSPGQHLEFDRAANELDIFNWDSVEVFEPLIAITEKPE